MASLLPETQDLLLLMRTIANKQEEREKLDKNKGVRVPAETSALFRREEMEQMIAGGRSLVSAVHRIAEKDDELKIVFCESNESCDKAKDGHVRLCRVSRDRCDNLLQLLATDLPADGHNMHETLFECDRLSVRMEKQSIHATRTASELRNMLRRLDHN